MFCLKYTGIIGVLGSWRWTEPLQSHVLYLLLILFDSKSNTRQLSS